MSSAAPPSRFNFLFITWDGPQTRYLESLFLPIFVALRARGHRPHVLQFNWGDAQQSAGRAAACAAAGIPYHGVELARHSSLRRQFFALSFAVRHLRRAISRWQIDLLIPRSLMPALMVLRLPWRQRQALHLVFDADGLMADERVDFAGLSDQGPGYAWLRWIEAQMLRRADLVLCRTEAARQILLARAGPGLRPEACHLVINGLDPAPYALALEQAVPAPAFTLCYCGSLGPQYRLGDMLDIAMALRRRIPALRFALFTPQLDLVAAALAQRGLSGAAWITARSLTPAELPAALAACDLGLSLRGPSFSGQAVQPIKLADYLLAGVPVLADPAPDWLLAAGVGQGFCLQDPEPSFDWVCQRLFANRRALASACHRFAQARLSHNASAASYDRALRQLPPRPGQGAIPLRSGRHHDKGGTDARASIDPL